MITNRAPHNLAYKTIIYLLFWGEGEGGGRKGGRISWPLNLHLGDMGAVKSGWEQKRMVEGAGGAGKAIYVVQVT